MAGVYRHSFFDSGDGVLLGLENGRRLYAVYPGADHGPGAAVSQG